MEPTWQFGTLPTTDKSEGQRSAQMVKQLLDKAVGDLGRQYQQPLLPAFFPIAVGGKVICRTYDGIYVLDLKQAASPSGGPTSTVAPAPC